MTHYKPVVLLVEDSVDDEFLTTRALVKTRVLHELVVTQNGNEALDYLFSSGSYLARDPEKSPALVFLDLKLPGMSGHEVLKRIRADERTQKIPVIVLSTSTNIADREASYEYGADSYVAKDINFVKFQEDVLRICHKWLV